MREIKFRVWDRETKYMLHNDIYPKTKRDWDLYEQSLDVMLGVIELDYDLMQYTGLKDKNGKEIYEGDIVRFYFSADTGINGEGATEIIDSVTFENGCFYFMNHDVGKGAYAWRYNEYCEVIGNIHENPELLK